MFVSANVGGEKRGPFDDFWYYPVGNATASGMRVSPQTAIAVTAMFSCALVMGQTIGMLPVHLHQRLARGQKVAVEHPLYRVIHRRPNRWQTPFQWFQMMQWHLMLRYNAYSEIRYDRRGHVEELVPIHPDRVTVERFTGADGVVNFRYRVRDAAMKDAAGAERILVRGEVFHVRGLTSDGVEGFSPLEAQRESIGEALAAQGFTSRFLQNDARPGGVLEWPGHFKDDEERRNFRRSWQDAQTGSNRGKTAVLEKGMTFKEIGVKNTDIQLVELRKLKAYDIASMNRMPPHKIGLMERATFTNIEHQAIEFATDTVQPWCVNWEQELANQLLLDGEQDEFYFKFAMNALLRGDAKSRSEYYGKMFQTGAMSTNDIRGLEDENPVDGGDRRFVPVNMVPLDRVDDVVDKGGNRDSGAGNGGDQGGREGNGTSKTDAIERASAERVVRKEVSAQRRLLARATGADVLKQAEEFYRGHATFVQDVMYTDMQRATNYCARRLSFLRAAVERGETPEDYLSDLEQSGPGDLLTLMRKEEQ